MKVVSPDEEGSTKMIGEEDRTRIKKQIRNTDSLEEAMHLRTEKDVRKSVKRKYIEEEPEEEYEPEDDDKDDYDPKMERITTILAVIAAILVGKAFGVFGESAQDETIQEEQQEEKAQVQMIGVVGKNIDDVKVSLLNLGLTPEIEYEESTQYEQGIVIRADKTEGEMLPEGSNVVLTVSAGSEGIEVPDVVGMTEAEAVAELGKKGFGVSKTESADEYIKKGSIVEQSPKGGSKAPSGSTVTITISLGKDSSKVRVPNVIGRDESEAMAILVEAGLQMGVVSEVNNENADLTGLVCYQSYSVGSYVDVGTAVDVSISLGPIQST